MSDDSAVASRSSARTWITQLSGLDADGLAKCCQQLGLTGIYVACFNSKRNLTVAGPTGEMSLLGDAVVSSRHLWRSVDTKGKAFHSPALRSRAALIQSRLCKALQQVSRTREGESVDWTAPCRSSSSSNRSCRWLSTSSSSTSTQMGGGLDQVVPAVYFAESLYQPVHFSQVVDKLPEGAIVVEVGPR